MANVPISLVKRVQGPWAPVPQWLADPEGVAPCACGADFDPQIPYIVATSSTGLRRWFHQPCWYAMMGGQTMEDES